MSDMPNEKDESTVPQQSDFERITALVSQQFQVEEAVMESGVPTYYLKQPQETKQPFLTLLKYLDYINLMPVLRRIDQRIVLKVIPKPKTKPSNIAVNWILFFATVATTFVTGYMISPDVVDPIFGGITFTFAMLAVLGIHEMGHKVTANKRGIEATPPYFIPGPPPNLGGFGTFGAVIMQKSLPPNRDALFDIGADGPISGFIVATIVSFIGLMFLIPAPPDPNAVTLGSPVLWIILERFLSGLNLMPQSSAGGMFLLHPIAFAGWVGLLVTMLNLLPAGMLDGGHVVRSIVGEKMRIVLSALSFFFLILQGFYPMAFFVLFLSFFRHPGPLDDVSGLSNGRKLTAVGLVVIFVLSSFITPVFQ
jgi:membrane-associated protease RseP (regulator of RpoE activity)